MYNAFPKGGVTLVDVASTSVEETLPLVIERSKVTFINLVMPGYFWY